MNRFLLRLPSSDPLSRHGAGGAVPPVTKARTDGYASSLKLGTDRYGGVRIGTRPRKEKPGTRPRPRRMAVATASR